MADMSRAQILTSAQRRALSPGVEYEFERLTISREFSRSSVTVIFVTSASSSAIRSVIRSCVIGRCGAAQFPETRNSRASACDTRSRVSRFPPH